MRQVGTVADWSNDDDLLVAVRDGGGRFNWPAPDNQTLWTFVHKVRDGGAKGQGPISTFGQICPEVVRRRDEVVAEVGLGLPGCVTPGRYHCL
jgi:hypothetical protein